MLQYDARCSISVPVLTFLFISLFLFRVPTKSKSAILQLELKKEYEMDILIVKPLSLLRTKQAEQKHAAVLRRERNLIWWFSPKKQKSVSVSRAWNIRSSSGRWVIEAIDTIQIRLRVLLYEPCLIQNLWMFTTTSFPDFNHYFMYDVAYGPKPIPLGRPQVILLSPIAPFSVVQHV